MAYVVDTLIVVLVTSVPW